MCVSVQLDLVNRLTDMVLLYNVTTPTKKKYSTTLPVLEASRGVSASKYIYIYLGNLASFVLYAAYVGIGLSGVSTFYAETMKGNFILQWDAYKVNDFSRMDVTFDLLGFVKRRRKGRGGKNLDYFQ